MSPVPDVKQCGRYLVDAERKEDRAGLGSPTSCNVAIESGSRLDGGLDGSCVVSRLAPVPPKGTEPPNVERSAVDAPPPAGGMTCYGENGPSVRGCRGIRIPIEDAATTVAGLVIAKRHA